MSEKPSAKKILYIALPLLAGLAVILILNRNKNRKIPKYPPVEPTNTKPAVKKTTFPLKKGSKGELVIQLQQVLNSKGANLKTDGDWGPLTDAAMKQYLGISQVNDQVQYDQIVNSYKASAQASSAAVQASFLSNGLIVSWNANPSRKFTATKDFAATVVTVDYLKNTISTGNYLNIKKGEILSRLDFKPVGIAKNGMLIMKYSQYFGLASGNCIFNPAWVTLI